MSKLPDCSDWYARKPSGTRKNTASHSTPGASSRYGVSCRCRWRYPTAASAGDQVLPGSQVLLVVERVVVEDVDRVDHLLRREDQRVLRDRGVRGNELLLRAGDRADVVDARVARLRVAALDQRGDLRVVDVVHEHRRGVRVSALRDDHVVRPDRAS